MLVANMRIKIRKITFLYKNIKNEKRNVYNVLNFILGLTPQIGLNMFLKFLILVVKNYDITSAPTKWSSKPFEALSC